MTAAESRNINKTTAMDIVVQSNNLVEAFYDSDLTATEHKIIRYAASKIKKNPEDFPTVTFTVQEFLDAAGLKGNSYHDRFEKVTDELTRKRIKIKSNDKTGYFPYLSALIYDEGTVELTFNTFIKPMILQLDSQFTKYNYKYIGDMKSGYSIRIFELLKQYAPIGERRIKVDTLKNMLGLGDKYQQYGQFKLRVLKQAQKELDKKKDLTFTFDEIKEGRKVTELVFKINMKKQNDKKQTPVQNQDQFVKEVLYLLESYSFKISEKQIRQWQHYGIELISEVFEELKDRKMDHPASYITTVLKAKKKEQESKEQELKSDLKTSDVKSLKDIQKFIKQHTSPEVMPDWWVKTLFTEHMIKMEYNMEEIEEMWALDGDYIMEKRYVVN